jgi:hypothetical protein
MGEEKKSNYIIFYEIQSYGVKFIIYNIIAPLIILILFNLKFFHNPRNYLSELHYKDYIFISIFSLLPILSLITLYSIKLTTEVRQDGIYYQKTRIDKSFNKISFNEVKNYWIRNFSLFPDDGNIKRRRLKSHESTYIVKGKKGIQFELKDGKELLLSSQKPEEFIRAINTAMENH